MEPDFEDMFGDELDAMEDTRPGFLNSMFSLICILYVY